jgi:hypothetical protein
MAQQETVRALHKKSMGTNRKALVTTGMNNLADLAASSSSASLSNPVQAQPENHGTYLLGLLGEVKKGGEDVNQATVKTAEVANLPADQLSNLQNILATLGQHRETTYERDHWERERLCHMTDPIDINGNPNTTNEPVYYRPSATSPKTVAGIPYLVSDIIYACNRCTYNKKCERHAEPAWQKTSASLCSASHLRMTVSWDVTDPDNRKGTWIFDIESKFDRFDHPEQERDTHERALAAKRTAQENDEEVSDSEQGCCPVEPKWKIKELVKRMLEDHNEHQAALSRREFLDPKGRAYFTKKWHWGGKDPFTPSEASRTRAARQYVPLDGSRVERELRVLLQAWHKAQVKPGERMRDRTTASMKKVWEEKMVEEKARRAVRGLTERVEASVREKKVREEPKERFHMSTWDVRVIDAARAAPIETEKAKDGSRDLTADGRKILKKMTKAAEIEATEAAEKKAQTLKTAAQDASPDSPHLPVKPLNKPKKTAPKPTTTKIPAPKPTKRKTATILLSNPSKKYKSAAIIDDSDDEADYALPVAPMLELPEQHEGWAFTEALSSGIVESVHVVQTDDASTSETAVVVEQGTTIVKEIEIASPLPASEVEEEDEGAATPPAYASPAPSTPSTSAPSSPNKKRKALFEDSDESDDNKSSSSKKAKKVSFSAALMSPVETPRKLSMVYILNGEEQEQEQDDESDEEEVDVAVDEVDHAGCWGDRGRDHMEALLG